MFLNQSSARFYFPNVSIGNVLFRWTLANIQQSEPPRVKLIGRGENRKFLSFEAFQID